MDMQLPATGCSDFMATHLPVYFERFGMHYTIDGPQLEYFVYKKENGEDISCSLTGYFDGQNGTINMMTFYPGICAQKDCHYLSAVCFFLIMQHFANFHHIESDCQILFNTRQGIFDRFWALLQDFDFHIMVHGEGDRVDIQSLFQPLGMDTSMISERAIADQA
jgi:hypothetical protein